MSRSTDAPALGPRLQQIRKDRHLTLDQLAARSQVSRSMLSQIERGAANPTFATLWQLTRALDVDFGDLLGMTSNVDQAAVEVTEAHFTPEIKTRDGGCVLRILSPADQAGSVEWYDLTILPGGELASEPHAKGAREHLTVIEGEFEVQSGEQTVKVAAGATARYAADLPHRLKNPLGRASRGILVVLSI
jgi:transcriptional regulator with XRE-family HTH domain